MFQTQMSRLSEPYGYCTDDKPEGYLYDRDYSTEGCQRSRYQYEMIENCDCYDPNYPQPNGTTVSLCNVDDHGKFSVNTTTTDSIFSN